MLNIKRTDSKDQDFIRLVKSLDMDLAIRDGEDHSFYATFNQVDEIKYVLVAYSDNIPVGCGAIKHFESNVVEIKRMFTRAENRGEGIASKILQDLELWAKELSYQKCILETGIKQPEAIRLYKKNGYQVVQNYGQYANVANSICFEKSIKVIW